MLLGIIGFVVIFLLNSVLICVFAHYIFYIFVCLLSYAMQWEDAKYIKRKLKTGSVDVHPKEKALVISYELEAQLLSGKGNTVLGSKKHHKQIIHLNDLNSESDCANLAKEVIKHCNLIHPSKCAEVEQLIYYLKKREEQNKFSHNKCRGKMSPIEVSSGADMEYIDDYIELLYDEIQEKIRGSALILQLARNPDNLLELAKNEALLSALSRVLREEWRRSIELSTNIVYTFFCFSTYKEFHSVIIQYKIGSLCMDVIDYELKRYDQWKEKVDGKKAITPDKVEPPKSRIPEPKRRPKSGTWAVADVGGLKSRSANSSYHEDLCSASDDKNDEEQMRRKLRTLAKRQEQLLRVAFYLLLNIADNVKVEEKMHKREIVGLLIGALERHSNIDLLVLIVSFLQKLSIYVENKNGMASRNIIDKLLPLLDSANPDLVNVTLKLLFNLTFDTKLRNKMIKLGILPKLIKFTSDDKHVPIVMKILYHLSMDDRVKIMFAQMDCVKLIIDMLLLSGGGGGGGGGAGGVGSCAEEPDALVALCVNCAWSERCAAQMAGEGRLRELLTAAFRLASHHLMKIVCNLSHHHNNKPLFVEFVGDIAGAVTSGEAHEQFVAECVGTLANILTADIDVAAVLQRYDLLDFIMKHIDPERGTGWRGGLCVEAVRLAAAVCGEAGGAAQASAAGAAPALVRLLRARQADDDLVLHTVRAFRMMLAHPLTARHLVNDTEAPAYLIDLMQDKNTEIRRLCDSCLDVISQMETEWAARIKVERFRCHNGQWLSVVETLSEEPSGEEELPPYLSAAYLTTHNLAPSDSQTSLNNESDSLSGENDFSKSHSRYMQDVEEFDLEGVDKNGAFSRSLSSIDNESLLSADLNLIT